MLRAKRRTEAHLAGGHGDFVFISSILCGTESISCEKNYCDDYGYYEKFIKMLFFKRNFFEIFFFNSKGVSGCISEIKDI